MKIGIMGAMSEEIGPLLEKFTYKTVEYANNKYYLASYKEHELVIAYSKIGKVNATITACVLIEHFNCEMLLFSGVAGALNEAYEIKDILIGEDFLQHDVDITGFGHPFGFIPEGEIFTACDENLIKIAKTVAQENSLQIHNGRIATGDQFINDEAKKTWIREHFQADAVEMEGASVALTCQALKIPCLIIRTMSDKAGKEADMNFDEFILESAKISADFLYKIIDKL